jgi:hypothetical protein
LWATIKAIAMTETEIIQLPKFSNYREENCDYGYEALQDFFLSWTLRCAEEKYQAANPQVNEYARRAIFILVHGKNINGSFVLDSEIPEDFKVLKVATKRQDGGVDLIALVTIVDETNQHKKFVLNIENKWYYGLKEHQLEKSKTHVEKKFSDYEIVNLFITCDDCRKNYEQEKEWCQQSQYKFLTIGDIAATANMEPTGNALFDAYWFDV